MRKHWVLNLWMIHDQNCNLWPLTKGPTWFKFEALKSDYWNESYTAVFAMACFEKIQPFLQLRFFSRNGKVSNKPHQECVMLCCVTSCFVYKSSVCSSGGKFCIHWILVQSLIHSHYISRHELGLPVKPLVSRYLRANSILPSFSS